MSNESIVKTIIVVVGVCLVCSLLVSSSAVKLLPLQQKNKKFDKVKKILVAGDLYSEDADIVQTYEERVEPYIIDLNTGEYLNEESFDDLLNIENFDITTLSNHPQHGRKIPQNIDIADIKQSPKFMLVYLVKEGDELAKVILPVYGKGLWSTMYAFLSLDKDFKTVTGVTFYEHGETPGLGGEIENPRWNDLWRGKKAFDDNYSIQLEIIKGIVDQSRPEADHQVDGLSGATITTRGVDLMIKFWLGENGYASFLSKLRERNL